MFSLLKDELLIIQVLKLLQDLVRKCEMYVAEHQRFDESCEDYTTWYNATTQALQELHNSTGSKDDIENRIIKLKVRRS